MKINYEKRKNVDLFKTLEKPEFLSISKTQNYIPIYNRFFALNDTNYNSINLNHKWFLYNAKHKSEESDNILVCKIKNSVSENTKERKVFFKMAPLFDPFKYLVGKYDVENIKYYTLPILNSTENDCYSKFLDYNNSAYVDSFFIFLTSNLIYTHNFHHGVDFFGSYLGIKNDFKINIFDDLDYLHTSEFFNKNKNVLFKVDDYSNFVDDDEPKKLKPIKIDNETKTPINLSIKSVDINEYNDIFDDEIKNNNKTDDVNTLIDLNELKEMSMDISSIHLSNNDMISTINSTSTCSSRTSHTCENDILDDESCDNCSPSVENDNDMVGENINYDSDNDNNDNNDDNNDDSNNDNNDEWEDVSCSSGNSSFNEEIIINATISKFPVHLIAMDSCENTFDNLILTENLSEEEWLSALMQIIMILITFQKAFAFTHNDLHTNNVMYNQTDKKYLYYCYKKKIYKVPTFGRIFKIIDFGRSIYKFDGNLFCSDSFQVGGDAATQYNTEPYFNDKKPRLEPNYSFDLCRLACSIFDYVIDDMEETKDIKNCNDSVKKIIFEWCLDDKGINMLYKNNGVDRYPDFKLYKMIARCVHNHTPQAQLERDEFKKYIYTKTDVPNDMINIDNIPSYI